MNTSCVNDEKMTNFSDAQLAGAFLNGDESVFSVIVERYSAPLFTYIFHMVGEYDQTCDILQEVFIRLYTAFARINTERPLLPWLYQVAHNQCIDEFRKRTRAKVTHFSQMEVEAGGDDISLIEAIPDYDYSVEDQANQNQVQAQLRRALACLSPKYRSIVILHYAAGMSFSQVGRTLGLPEPTTKTYFYRAKVQLRTILESWGMHHSVDVC